jgi:hypothetical protein
MPLTNPDQIHLVPLSNRALAFLSNCMSFRGGTHPGNMPKFKDVYMEAQDAVLNAFGEPVVQTCSAIDQTTIYTECDGKHQAPAEALTPTRDDLLEEIDEAWKELARLSGTPGAEVYPNRGGPLWEGIEVLRIQLNKALKEKTNDTDNKSTGDPVLQSP